MTQALNPRARLFNLVTDFAEQLGNNLDNDPPSNDEVIALFLAHAEQVIDGKKQHDELMELYLEVADFMESAGDPTKIWSKDDGIVAVLAWMMYELKK